MINYYKICACILPGILCCQFCTSNATFNESDVIEKFNIVKANYAYFDKIRVNSLRHRYYNIERISSQHPPDYCIVSTERMSIDKNFLSDTIDKKFVERLRQVDCNSLIADGRFAMFTFLSDKDGLVIFTTDTLNPYSKFYLRGLTEPTVNLDTIWKYKLMKNIKIVTGFE